MVVKVNMATGRIVGVIRK